MARYVPPSFQGSTGRRFIQNLERRQERAADRQEEDPSPDSSSSSTSSETSDEEEGQGSEHINEILTIEEVLDNIEPREPTPKHVLKQDGYILGKVSYSKSFLRS